MVKIPENNEEPEISANEIQENMSIESDIEKTESEESDGKWRI